MRWLARIIVPVAVLASWCNAAFATDGPTVVVLSGSDEELGRKLRAEAIQAGLDVVSAPGGDESGDKMTNGATVVGVLRVLSRDQVEIRIPEDNGSDSVDEVLRREPTDGDSFALRVVEELRARLVELKLWTPPAKAEATPAPKPAPTARTDTLASSPVNQPPFDSGAHEEPVTRPILWPLAGIAGIAPVGGLGTSAHAAFGLRVEPVDALAITAQALIGITEAELHEAEGSAAIQTHVFALQLGYSPFAPTASVQVETGLGAALLVLDMQGTAAPSYQGSKTQSLSGLYFVHADLAHAFARSLRVRGSLLFGVSAPRPVVEFDDREIAAWGRPFAGALVTAELGLPVPVRESP